MLSASPPLGDLVLLTWTPDGPDSPLGDGFDDVADAAARRGAVLLAQRVFTTTGTAPAVQAALQSSSAAAAAAGIAATVVGHQAGCGGEVGGIHALAVVGVGGDFVLEHHGRAVGRVLRGRAAEYLALSDPLRGLRPLAAADPAAETRRVLEAAAEILSGAGWSFAQVRRTWLYLRDILSWYDRFNDARNRFFDELGLDLGDAGGPLPASTGIEGCGPDGAWCTLDLLAVRGSDGAALPVRRLVNPRQNEAPEYGSAFARGLEVAAGDARQLWISGTAAIDRLGRSVELGDAAGQIEATLDNVDALLGSAGAGLGDLSQATLFVKRRRDLPTLRAVLDRRGLGGLHAVCAVADVCRDELLFELDATAIVPR